MPWNRGRSTILVVVERGELGLVEPSAELAERLIAIAATHLELARSGLEVDPVGSLQLSYDAARNINEYPTEGDEAASLDDARTAFEIAVEVVSSARALLGSGRLTRFG